MTDAPICICGHYRSDHDDQSNPKCVEGTWITTAEVPRGDDFQTFALCDCPGFEADPKANGDNQ